MSNSMVSTILQIEREADALLDNARKEAEALIAEAKSQSERAARQSEKDIEAEIASLEERAAADRNKHLAEAEAAGNAALSKVTGISEAVIDDGVRHVMNLLAGR